MFIVITTTSVLGITVLVWLANRILPFRICPICAGVSGTWLWMFAGMFSGLLPTSGFQLLTAILMGGSVVGITYQIEKRLPRNRLSLLWKTLFIPAGFIAVNGVLTRQWGVFLALLIFLLLITLVFLFFRAYDKPAKKAVSEIERKMEDCC